jgi:hypothetical protein
MLNDTWTALVKLDMERLAGKVRGQLAAEVKRIEAEYGSPVNPGYLRDVLIEELKAATSLWPQRR